MKLVLAIIHDNDAPEVMSLLAENKFFVTKLATTGGFLKSGNTTLITGVEDSEVEAVLHIFEAHCKSRTEMTTLAAAYGSMEGFIPHPIEVRVGGATIFVLDVAQFRKF